MVPKLMFISKVMLKGYRKSESQENMTLYDLILKQEVFLIQSLKIYLLKEIRINTLREDNEKRDYPI